MNDNDGHFSQWCFLPSYCCLSFSWQTRVYIWRPFWSRAVCFPVVDKAVCYPAVGATPWDRWLIAIALLFRLNETAVSGTCSVVSVLVGLVCLCCNSCFACLFFIICSISRDLWQRWEIWNRCEVRTGAYEKTLSTMSNQNVGTSSITATCLLPPAPFSNKHFKLIGRTSSHTQKHSHGRDSRVALIIPNKGRPCYSEHCRDAPGWHHS